jgi:hypothetical protein
MHQCLVFVHAVDHQSSSPPDIVDAVVRQFFHSSSLHNDIKAVWVVLLEFLPLRFGVLAIKLDVFIACIEIFSDVHLDTFVSCDHDAGGTILLEELCKDKTRWPSTHQEDFDADAWVELVEPMNSARSWLKKGGLFISEVVDLVKLL